MEQNSSQNTKGNNKEEAESEKTENHQNLGQEHSIWGQETGNLWTFQVCILMIFVINKWLALTNPTLYDFLYTIYM